MKDMISKKDAIYKILPSKIRKILDLIELDYDFLQELRFRIGSPFLIVYDGKEFFVSEQGKLVKDYLCGYIITMAEIKETIEYISSYSLYAYEDEIRQGFITVQGGHRVGLAGKVIVEHGKIKSIKHISFINIRMSHEKMGCGNIVMPYLYGNNNLYHTLIISPPRSGKTTLLRDIVRSVSNGTVEHEGMTVGVVDERSEIAACYRGIPQNDIGVRTDVLDCCSKAEGMLMLIRSMSPNLIAVDEIGKKEDVEAIAYVMNCGCCILATVHGSSIDDVKCKPILGSLIEEHIFKRFIILKGANKPGKVQSIMDDNGNLLFAGE